MRGEIYDPHRSRFDKIRELQSMYGELTLGGALSLKARGLKIPDTWYNIFFYTPDLYKIEGEEVSSFLYGRTYKKSKTSKVRLKRDCPQEIRITQQINKEIIEDRERVIYHNNSYYVAPLITVASQYLDLIEAYWVGHEEFRAIFGKMGQYSSNQKRDELIAYKCPY